MSKFYKGIVVENNDPLRRGRVKVKINGVDDNSSVKSLVWSDVVQSVFLGISGGCGAYSVLPINTSVWVQFDNDNPNAPIVVGVLVGGTEGRSGTFDVDLNYKNANKHPDWATDSIPYHSDVDPRGNLKNTGTVNTVYEDKYLTTNIIKTRSGHTIELDDSEVSSAIRIRHGSGLSCVTLNEDGSVDIKGDMIRFSAIQDIMFKAGRNMYLEIDGSYYNNTKKSITDTTEILTSKADKVLNYSKGDITTQVESGNIFTAINEGMYALHTKDKINISSSDESIFMNAETEIANQCGSGSIILSQNGASINSNQNNILLNANKVKVNTDLQIFGGVNATSVIQSSSYVLGKDLLPCIPMNFASSALNESINESNETLQQYGDRKVEEFNKQLVEIRESDISLQKEKYNTLSNEYNEFRKTIATKAQSIKKSILQDYIASQKEVFGGVNSAEIQYLTEAVNNPIEITSRNPDGQKLFEEDPSDCNCNWLDPSKWFNIDMPVFPSFDDFKNMFSFSIEFPTLSELLPNLPKFSMLALVQIVMQIAALKIIKLLSLFKSLIMRMLAPVIQALNKLVAIVNMIPPKIKIDIDLKSMIPVPLFSLPQFPEEIGIPNICCAVNHCNKSGCKNTNKLNEYQQNLNEKIVKTFGSDEPRNESEDELEDDVPLVTPDGSTNIF